MNITSNKGLSFPVLCISGIIISIFFLITFFSLSQIRNNIPHKDFKLLETLMKAKKFTEALELVNSFPETRENEAFVLCYKGKIYFSLAVKAMDTSQWISYGQKDYDWLVLPEADSALHYFLRSLSRQPMDNEAYYYLGVLYREKGMFSKAEAELLHAKNVQSTRIDASIALATVYTAEQKLYDAEHELREAYVLAPHYPPVSKNLMILYRYYYTNEDSALNWANRYLNSNPKNDYDRGFIEQYIIDTLKKYPRLQPAERMNWKKKRRFKDRTSSK